MFALLFVALTGTGYCGPISAGNGMPACLRAALLSSPKIAPDFQQSEREANLDANRRLNLQVANRRRRSGTDEADDEQDTLTSLGSRGLVPRTPVMAGIWRMLMLGVLLLLSSSAWAQDWRPPAVAGASSAAANNGALRLVNTRQEDPDPFGFGDPAESGEPLRYLPDGNGKIPVADPFDYPRIPFLDCEDPNSIWYTYRPNLFGVEVTDEWDFYNLINTDRPDFTDATYTAGKGVTIIENGYTFRYIEDHESNSRQARRSLPESLIRYGVTDEFEVRLKWNGYVMSDFHNLTTGARDQIFGGDDLYAAIKWELFQQQGARPMLTFLTGATIPSGTNGISSNTTQPFVNFVAGWGLRRWLYLKASMGIDWQRTSISTLIGGGSEPIGPTVLILRDNINVYHGSMSLLYQATKRIGGFVEVFGFAQTNGEDNRGLAYFDTGWFIYATTNIQFDVRIGTRLSDRVDEIFTGAGLSLRF